MPKGFLTYQQLVEKLKRSGLTIANEETCRAVLENVGYFPVINGYQVLFRDPSTRIYREGVAFEDILALYKFDRELRSVVLGAVLSVEARLRSVTAHEFCAVHGDDQSAYLDPAVYSSSKGARRILPRLIETLGKIANSDESHHYLVHYRKAYGNVPLWVAVNAMTFGQLSKMYSTLTDADKRRIAKRYGSVNSKELAQFVRVLSLFRNVCAHGERLFSHKCHVDIPDTVLHDKIGIVKSGPGYTCGKNDLFAVVIALRYVMPSEQFIEFKKRLNACITRYCNREESIGESSLLNAMGFPAEWKKITRFKLW